MRDARKLNQRSIGELSDGGVMNSPPITSGNEIVTNDGEGHHTNDVSDDGVVWGIS
jgi:hypothetical protein